MSADTKLRFQLTHYIGSPCELAAAAYQAIAGHIKWAPSLRKSAKGPISNNESSREDNIIEFSKERPRFMRPVNLLPVKEITIAAFRLLKCLQFKLDDFSVRYYFDISNSSGIGRSSSLV